MSIDVSSYALKNRVYRKMSSIGTERDAFLSIQSDKHAFFGINLITQRW